jgi:cell filamentation protein
VPGDPYADPATGVLRNNLGLDTAEELAAAEREITHAALILLRESPVRPSYDLRHLFSALREEDRLQGLERGAFIDRLTFYLGEVNAVHPFREGNGRAQRAFFEQLARDAGFTLNWSTSTQPATSRHPQRSCAATLSRCGRCSTRL